MNTKTTESDRICPACGEGRLHAETEMETVEYHGQTGLIELHFAVCDTCGSDLTDAADARRNKRAMNAFKKQVDGLLTGAEIRAFRERFGLTQKTAADLIGGGEVAFSRYESDDIVQSAPMDTALRLCVISPSNLLTLAHEKGVELSKETVLRIEKKRNETPLPIEQHSRELVDLT